MKKILSVLLSLTVLSMTLAFLPAKDVKAVTTIDIAAASINIATGGDYEITGTGSPTANTITVSTAADVNITLNNVNIDVSAISNACALKIESTAGNVTVDLKGTNVLKSGDNCAGLQKDTDNTKSLTIKSTDGTGSLTATGGRNGAAIGGGGDICNAYNITISGGIINANGGEMSAGIGGGCLGDASNITISGGTVNATGGELSEGIGGGYAIIGSNIKITGGSVNASPINYIPTNGTTPVYKTTISLKDVSTETAVTDTSVTGYGTNGIKTDTSGKLYFYLPVDTTVTSVTADGKTYTGSVTTLSAGTASATFTLLTEPSFDYDWYSIYANGNPLIIADGTTAGTTTIYVDKDGDGTPDSGEELTGATNANLSEWYIYGGVQTGNVPSTKITMIGGNVSGIYGGGYQANVTGTASIDISGGIVTYVSGNGGFNGTNVVNANININGGTIIGNISTNQVTTPSIKITGGTIQGEIPVAPTNGTTPVQLYTLTLNGVSAISKVTALRIQDYTYGASDIYTDASGKLYVYLPSGITDKLVSATVDGLVYCGKIDSNDTTLTLLSTPYVQSDNVYANGYPILITDGTTPGTTTVYWDKGTIGVKDASDEVISGAENTDKVYSFYGGCQIGNLLGDTTITMLGGRADYIFGGGDTDTIIGNTSLTINGGVIESGVSGGSLHSDIKGSINVTVNGGDIGSVWGVSNYTALKADSTTVTINGGTIRYTVDVNSSSTPTKCLIIKGGTLQGLVNGTPSDDINSVYKKEIILSGVTSETAVTATDIKGYGLKDVKTTAGGRLYFYLPNNKNITSVTAGGKTYTGSLTTNPDGTASGTFNLALSKYNVTINDGGTGVTGSGSYEAGATVTLTPGTKNGFTFSGWTSPDVTITGNTFTMPAKAVTVTANWTAVSTPPSPPSPPATPTAPTDNTPGVTNTTVVVDKMTDSAPGSIITTYGTPGTAIPKEVLQAAKEKGDTLIVDYGWYYWTIDGKTVTTPMNIDLTLLKDSDLQKGDVIGFEIAFDGKLPFSAKLTVTIPAYIKDGSALYLYQLDGTKRKFDSEGVAKSASVTFDRNHASQYVISTVKSDLSAGEGAYENMKSLEIVYNGIPYLIICSIIAVGGTLILKKKAKR